jgi:hypothetical protein
VDGKKFRVVLHFDIVTGTFYSICGIPLKYTDDNANIHAEANVAATLSSEFSNAPISVLFLRALFALCWLRLSRPSMPFCVIR